MPVAQKLLQLLSPAHSVEILQFDSSVFSGRIPTMPQVKLSREQLLALLLILFAAWCGISWRWYTCGIKGFCGEATTEKTSEVRETPLVALSVAEAAPEALPSSATPTPEEKNGVKNEQKKIPTPTKPSPTYITTPAMLPSGTTIEEAPKRIENCSTYINKKLSIATRNDPALISKLERFMNRVAGEPLAEDGMFGPNDIATVKNYQRSQNLSPTGVVDQETAFYINRDVCSFPGSLLE